MSLVAFFTLEKPAYAHIGWFVDKGHHSGAHYSIDVTTVLIIVGAMSFVVLALVIDRGRLPARVRVVSERAYGLFPEGNEWRIVASLAGVLLIVNSTTDVFLAANLVLPNEGLITIGKMVQLVIGLLLVSQISFSLAGLLILVVVLPLAAIYIPISSLVDYIFEFVALALSLMFVGISACYLDQLACKLVKHDPARFQHLPLPIIRIGVGLTLVVLAVHNKLLNANLSLTFLDEHNVNFMPYLGFAGFTDLHFALAAGVSELTIGLLLVFGIATRFVTAVLSMFFIGTLVVLGPAELMGHLPLFGIALLLIIRGSGSYRLGSVDVRHTLHLSRGLTKYATGRT